MTKVVAMIALLAGLLSGCFFGPTSDDGAEKLKNTIAGMPGVTRTAFSTNDAGWSTITLPHLGVTMPTATPQQIRAVVELLKSNPHKDLKTVAVIVAYEPSISVSGTVADIDAEQFIGDVERLRQLTPVVAPSAFIKWTRDGVPDGALDLSVESPLPTTLATIRERLGSIGQAEIRPGESSRVLIWKIHFPYSPDQERRVNSQLESIPLEVGSVTVDSGAITELNVAVTGSQAAESELSDVIAAVGAGPDAPLMLTWGVGQLTFGYRAGTVHVGSCAYPTTPGRDNLSPEEKALQERMRQQFDTCPR